MDASAINLNPTVGGKQYDLSTITAAELPGMICLHHGVSRRIARYEITTVEEQLKSAVAARAVLALRILAKISLSDATLAVTGKIWT